MLTFVARRLQAESVAMLFASRDDPAMDVRLAGLATLRLEGLDPAAAVASAGQTSLAAPIDPVAAARIARATGGNPLALIDLAQELSIAELTASSLADEPLPVGHRLDEHYVRQVRQLPGVGPDLAADRGRGLDREPRADQPGGPTRSASPPRRGMPPTRPGWSIWTR